MTFSPSRSHVGSLVRTFLLAACLLGLTPSGFSQDSAQPPAPQTPPYGALRTALLALNPGERYKLWSSGSGPEIGITRLTETLFQLGWRGSDFPLGPSAAAAEQRAKTVLAAVEMTETFLPNVVAALSQSQPVTAIPLQGTFRTGSGYTVFTLGYLLEVRPERPPSGAPPHSP